MATITKRNGSYLIRASCGFDGSGKRQRKCLTWTPPHDMTPKQADKEAQRQAVLFEEKCRTGQILDSNTRFSEFADKWLKDYAEKQLRPRTLASYKGLLTRILAAFGNMKLSAIQPHHLNAFYDNLAEAGVRADIKYKPCADFRKLLKELKYTQPSFAEKAGTAISVIKSCIDGRNVNTKSAEKVSKALGHEIDSLFARQEDNGLSNNTIHHYHSALSTILQTAVVWQIIPNNPCERVKPPKIPKKEARYLDEVGAAALISALSDEPFRFSVMIQIFVYTGLRRGELCGLEWRDVDFFTNCLHVRRSSLYTVENGVFTDDTKNDTSYRVIKLSENAIELLKQYKQWQDEYKNELGSKWQECGRLFTTWDGKPIHPDTVSGWFHDFIKRRDLPNVSIHSLRHTNATLQIMAGVNVKTVSNRLGHSSSVTTSNIYSHAIKSADEAAAEALQDILSPKSNQKRKSLKQA